MKLFPAASLRSFFACAILVSSLSLPARAADMTKADNTNALNLGTAWAGGVVPGAGDVALWDSTQTVNRANAIGTSTSTWAGIRITNPGGTLYTINNTASGTLVLGSSGIDMSSSTASLAIAAALNIAQNQTWTVAGGQSISLTSSVNSGTGNLTLAGSGTVIIGNPGVFGTGTLTLNNGINLTGNSASGRVISNATNLNGNIGVTMTGATASTIGFNGGIAVSSGTQTITMTNSLGSGTNPTVSLGGGGFAGTLQISGPGTLAFENGNPAETPLVSVRMGNGVSDYATVNTDIVIGSGVSMFFQTGLGLNANVGMTVQAGGILNLSNNGGSAISTTIGSLSGAGTVVNQRTTPGNLTLTIDGGVSTGTTTFSGNIVTGTGGASLNLTKTGNTTQILSGSNNYLGQTQVNAGTLLLNGIHMDSSGTTGSGYGSTTAGHFQVASGATFGGDGRITGVNAQNNSNLVLVQSGGFLTPGSATAELRLDGGSLTGLNARTLNMASGSEINLTLAGDGSSAGQIELWNYSSGDLLLNNNEINLTLEGPLVAGTHTYVIFEFYSNSGTTLTASGVTSGLAIGTVDPNIVGTPTILYDSAAGTISVQFEVVPEPGVCALLAGGLGFVLIFRRRRLG